MFFFVGVSRGRVEAELKKSMAQGEAVASKMKAVAAQENRELKNLFCQIDTDGSGTISADELDEALKVRTMGRYGVIQRSSTRPSRWSSKGD